MMKKGMNNVEVADLLRSIAAAYEIKDMIAGKVGASKFKIVAYQRAADAIEHLGSEAKDLYDDGKLAEVAGIGPAIGKYLVELFTKGTCGHFNDVLAGINPSVFELIKLPGIGPKTAYKLTKYLKIDPKDPFGSLKRYGLLGKIAEIEGFGEESQKEIIDAIDQASKSQKRYLLNYAIELSNSIIEWMKKYEKIVYVEALGSLRRKCATIGDIDIAVASEDAKRAIDHFARFPHKKRVIEKGDVSASILLPSGVRVDMKVQSPRSFGSLLQHFTGSKHHNIKLREYAQKIGLSLSERGIKVVKGKKDVPFGTYNRKKRIYEFEKEEDFYLALGLKWIPPELREDSGEIEVALSEEGFPRLVDVGDLRGDLQVHSSFDVETSHDLGLSSIEEIVEYASQMGYEYVALTEHNPSQRGHTEAQIIDILKRKKEKIEQINDSLSKQGRIKKLFNSLEIDILPNGKLAISERALEILDFALVSIHSSFRLDKDRMTKRVLSALENPKVKILAHPTARKLTKREGVEIDWEKVFDYCSKNRKWIEINSDPMRLDLPDYLVKQAIDKGVKLTIGTDSHHVDHLKNIIYGIYVARRGWAKKSDIVNTSSLEDFEKMLK